MLQPIIGRRLADETVWMLSDLTNMINIHVRPLDRENKSVLQEMSTSKRD